jgi:TonB-dependent SusC/RagA subfamily outer membrane receptor
MFLTGYCNLQATTPDLKINLNSEAQTITGSVTEEDGTAIPFASVNVKGTTKGTNTDERGKFSIEVDNEQSILVFSYIGYSSIEVLVGQQTSINVILKIDAKLLSEVVVVGYGIQKKVNLTGAVDQISSEVFDNRPLTNLNQGLQGVMPNLNIRMGDGKPNQAPSFNIRGATSIGQGGNALVLIDNVEGDPSLINPNDIASITLLKDAASASIYGARGVFGVILITTKNPTAGKTSINYSKIMLWGLLILSIFVALTSGRRALIILLFFIPFVFEIQKRFLFTNLKNEDVALRSLPVVILLVLPIIFVAFIYFIDLIDSSR